MQSSLHSFSLTDSDDDEDQAAGIAVTASLTHARRPVPANLFLRGCTASLDREAHLAPDCRALTDLPADGTALADLAPGAPVVLCGSDVVCAVDTALATSLGDIARRFYEGWGDPAQLNILQDTEAALCARHFFVSKVNNQTSVAEASKLGTSRYKLQRARTHCAAAALLHERLQALEVIHSVVGDVQARGGELICFFVVHALR